MYIRYCNKIIEKLKMMISSSCAAIRPLELHIE